MLKSATINDKKTEITLVLDYDKAGAPSKKRNKAKEVVEGEGKSLVHFTTHGNVAAEIGGVQHQVGINGYTPNPNYSA